MRRASSRLTLAALMIASCLLVRPGWAAGCSVPLESRNGFLITSVEIDGKGPFRFLFDTGTSLTVISPEVASTVGITADREIEAISTTGTVRVRQGSIFNVRTGAAVAPALRVLIGPVPQSVKYGRIDGILGMNFLARRSYFMDMRRGCLMFDLAPHHLTGGNRLRARELVGRVAVEIGEPEDSGLLFVLDSAASHLVLTSARAGALASRSDYATVDSAAGQQHAIAGTIPRLRLGDLALDNIAAVHLPRNDWPEDALLPTHVFSTIYVDTARSNVVLNGTIVD